LIFTYSKILILQILKYLGFKKINYNSSCIINFGSYTANQFFKQKLRKSNFYLEYGSGNSTLLADKYNKRFISVEIDRSFYKYIQKKIKNQKSLIFKSFGITGDYSTPVLFKFRKYFLRSKAINYSSLIFDFKFKKTRDLILIDGRYRVLCALKLHNFFLLKNKIPTIIVDDYINRDHYKILEKYFLIKKIGRMAVLEKIIPNDSKKLFLKYSLDCR